MKKIILFLSIAFTIQMSAQPFLGISGCYNVTSVPVIGMANTTWITYTPTADSTFGRRGFSISVPTGIPNATKKPVVIYNHADETVVQTADFVTGLYTKRNPTNGNDKFILVCTQAATDVYGNKLYANSNQPYSIIDSYNLGLTFYNTAPNSSNALINSVADEIKYLNIVIQLLQKGITLSNKLDNDRFYMVGYSGGAFLTQIAATKLNNSIAAFASVSGHKSSIIPHNNNFKNGKNFKIPMLLVNATADDAIGFTDTEATGKNIFCVGHNTTRAFWELVNEVQLKNQNDINTKPANIVDPNPNITVKRTNFKNTTTGAAIEYFKTFVIIGGGHHWHRPGGFADNNHTGLETNKLCFKINTTDEVWNFFKDKKRSLNGPDVPTDPILVVARTANPNTKNEIADSKEDAQLLTENSNSVLVYNSQDNNNLSVELKGLQLANYTFSILNLNNSIVKKQVINSTNEKLFEVNLDISDLPKGIYILQISTENKVIETKKFIK